MRVFISSTCYDLTDLRAELEAYFKGAGVEPVLSDSLTSDFQVTPDANSIETCLANVRTCDHFIIILSNRYGPSLKDAGFADVSATHLEYLEAKKAGIPIHMYVRDRLEADYAIWKANGAKPGLKLSWSRSEKDWPIFTLLEEHRKLQEAGGNNWLWTFRNSVELKDRIRRDFKNTFASAVVASLFNSGNMPLLEVVGEFHSFHGKNWNGSLKIRNVGQGIAVSPELSVVRTTNRWQIDTLHPKDEMKIQLNWSLQSGLGTALEIELTYSTLQGFKFVDKATLTLRPQKTDAEGFVKYTLKERRYIGATDAALLTMPRFDESKS